MRLDLGLHGLKPCLEQLALQTFLLGHSRSVAYHDVGAALGG
jgi:hypothetical protein